MTGYHLALACMVILFIAGGREHIIASKAEGICRAVRRFAERLGA